MSDQLSEAIAGALGGIVACYVLYPIEIVKNNMQASVGGSGAKTSFINVAQRIMASNGLAGFYDGVNTSSLHSVLEKFIYFYAYAAMQGLYKTRGAESIPVAANLVIGYLAEWSHLAATIPVESTFVRIQTGLSTDIADSARTIFAESGLSGFYSGWRTYFVLALKPAIEYSVFEQMKAVVLRRRGAMQLALSAAEAFMVGALARAVSTLICFPATRAKMILQGTKSGPGDDNKGSQEQRSALHQLALVLRKEGFGALYQGIGPEISRGILSSAIKMSIKERAFFVVQAFFAKK